MPSAPSVASGPPSLVGITVRRAFVMGRLYILLGLGYSLVLEIALVFTSPSAFVEIVSLFLPVFGAVGSLGALIVFTSDRAKGVLEYLIAYGFSPRRLFWNVFLASMVLVTVMVGVALGVGLTLFLARGNSLSGEFGELIAFYAVPMSYASAAFAATIGMYWTSLSSPREGMNSPVGLIPIVGIAPAILTFFVVVSVGAAHGQFWVEIILGSAVVIVAAIVVFLLALGNRLLPPERLLSPA